MGETAFTTQSREVMETEETMTDYVAPTSTVSNDDALMPPAAHRGAGTGTAAVEDGNVRNYPAPLDPSHYDTLRSTMTAPAPVMDIQGTPAVNAHSGSSEESSQEQSSEQGPSWTFDPKEELSSKTETTGTTEVTETPDVTPPPSATTQGTVPATSEEDVPAVSATELPHRELESISLPALGPVGKNRMPATVVFLSIVTLGIYALMWHHKVNREMGDFDPQMHVVPARSTWGIAIPWLVGVAAWALLGTRLALGYSHVSLNFNPGISLRYAWIGVAAVAVSIQYLALVLPFSLISVVMTAERVRIVQERGGATSDVQCKPVRMVWLLLIPVVGGLALMAYEQSRLNRVWELVAPPYARRRRG